MVAMKFNVTMLFLMVMLRGTAQVSFTPGNIVVYRVGTSGSALTSSATPVFLDEYTPAGVLVQSIAMPVAVSGSNQALTGAGTAGTEGIMTLSSDGQYLVVPGYNAVPGTANLASTLSTTIPRTIGLVKYDATINTTTALTDLSSSGSVRSAVSSNGTDIWACGNGTAGGSGGVRYASLGATTSTRLSTGGPGALRALNITSGQLYLTGNTSNPKLGVMGTGLPTTSGQTVGSLTGFPTGGTPGQFMFADLDAGVAGPDVLYVADDNTGLQKYSHVGGSWTLNGTVGTGTDDYRGLAISVSGTTVTLYTMRIGLNSAASGGGELVKLTDASGFNGAFSGTPTVLATAVTNNTSFRGVSMAPQSLVVTPVILTAFTARAINKDVQVAWSTTSAVNFSHFEVERSANGTTFTVAGKVNSRAANNDRVDYSFTDAGIMNTSTSNGIRYYRLKMVDSDGRFKHSKTVAVFMNEKKMGLINAYPAPFTNQVWVKIGVISAGPVSLSLTDLKGRVVKSMQLLLPAGENTVRMEGLGSLSRGAYLLRVTMDDKITSMKLIK